jgi:hypothetical protein
MTTIYATPPSWQNANIGFCAAVDDDGRYQRSQDEDQRKPTGRNGK